MKGTSAQSHKNRRTGMLLGCLVTGMFAFGFALVPLYDLFCEVAGIQTVGNRNDDSAMKTTAGAPPVLDRQVTIKFDASIYGNLPFDIKPSLRAMKVHPGVAYDVRYRVTNRSSQPVIGRAISNVIPWQASTALSKLECFCFQEQRIEGEETVDMALKFIVSPQLPAEINSLTLSYTFMKADKGKAPPLNSQLIKAGRNIL